ncbi:hypothetical protein J0X19_23270 [Hymenobacter sp. BT186]|uniref:Uncharacterized protein n=1 Tax=Hymenobacter telluris TaxID=2816474 RepID=A0A939F0I2_9BACT|nr:hypothetical protein [Hymenobacter telluris]MBO0360900.1 hypothetical protein [Hymenobacter telluris]MBW3376929.1 hypothetical protein [Hymenobacter norwichensis]
MVIKAEAPLYLVEIFYSMVFVLYYLTIFLLCAFWFRNQQIALVVAFLCVLLAARTFYWIESELPQALALLLLFYAGISRQAPLQRRFSTLALAALIPVYIFGHPLIILPFVFIWTYDWLLNRRFKDWIYYGLLIIGIGSYKMRDMLIEPGSYEANKMTFVPNLIAHFPNYLALQSFQDFWKLCGHNFIAVPILLFALSVFYIRQRTLQAWLRLLLVWAFAFGYVLVINVSYPEGTDATYIENLLLPLTLIITIPFAMELLPALEGRTIFKLRGTVFVTGVLAITFIIRLVVIWKNHTPTTAYQQWIGQMLAYTRQFPEHKFILAPENVNAERQAAGQPTWGITIESMLRSATYSPDSAQTIYAGTENYLLVEARAKGDLFIGPFEKWTIYDLPENYFRLPEKTYRTLNTPPPPEDTTALRTYIDARRAVRLTLADSLPAVLRSDRNQQVQVLVTVPNEAQPLHSSLNSSHPTLLRASFYQSPNWPSDVPPSETPLEVDVWHPWSQLITVHTPTTPGQYTLEITLFSKGYRDWPVRLLRTVEVK